MMQNDSIDFFGKQVFSFSSRCTSDEERSLQKVNEYRSQTCKQRNKAKDEGFERCLISKVQYITITKETAEQRIDNFLNRIFNNVPSNHFYRLIRKGELRVNKKRIDVFYRLQEGDIIRVPPLHQASKEQLFEAPEGIKSLLLSSILYEDEGLLVLNKPTRLAVHGGTSHEFGVIEALRASRPDLRHIELAHRLDQPTSGCLLLAKKRSILNQLHTLLRSRQIKKTYLALVHGLWPSTLKTISFSLKKEKLSSGEHYVRVAQEGKSSFTKVKIIKKFNQATLLELSPMTGRTHQLRVHTAHCGHPILGDDKYGDKKINQAFKSLGLKRLFLHAAQISLPDCDKFKAITFSAPLPQDLIQVIENLSF